MSGKGLVAGSGAKVAAGLVAAAVTTTVVASPATQKRVLGDLP
jgi:hypothetical protein